MALMEFRTDDDRHVVTAVGDPALPVEYRRLTDVDGTWHSWVQGGRVVAEWLEVRLGGRDEIDDRFWAAVNRERDAIAEDVSRVRDRKVFWLGVVAGLMSAALVLLLLGIVLL
ncbi:hypothetical protein [Mycolicibacterium vanbaalenii]|nr:hypothetical protein [Mycolicibacterium vanbaalenii]